jgi:CubicO group peptidase (beta-lactamase class C family)
MIAVLWCALALALAHGASAGPCDLNDALLQNVSDGHIVGRYNPTFASVVSTMSSLVANGSVRGGHFVVYHKGCTAVNVYGGTCYDSATPECRSDSLYYTWSTSKAFFGFALAIAQARGLVDFDEPVATYWPEFAAFGKEAITVGDVAVHRSRLWAFIEPPFVPLSIPKANSKNLTFITKTIEKTIPITPITPHVYHATSYSMLVAAVIQKAIEYSGYANYASFDAFMNEEIVAKVGGEIYFSSEPAIENRVVHLTDKNNFFLAFKSQVAQVCAPTTNPFIVAICNAVTLVPEVTDLELMNDPAFRRGLWSPGMNAFVSADAAAKFFGYMVSHVTSWGRDHHILKGKDLFPTYDEVYYGPDLLRGSEPALSYTYIGNEKPTPTRPWAPIDADRAAALQGKFGSGGQFCAADADNEWGFCLFTSDMELFPPYFPIFQLTGQMYGGAPNPPAWRQKAQKKQEEEGFSVFIG